MAPVINVPPAKLPGATAEALSIPDGNPSRAPWGPGLEFKQRNAYVQATSQTSSENGA